MFESLERFLNTPAPVIQISEITRAGIEQRSHQHAQLAVRRHLANQPNGRRPARTFIIHRILCIGRRQRHHRFILSGAHEFGDRLERRRRITTHAKRNPSMQQGCNQPSPRITAIKHQQVGATQTIKALEQHLSLTHQRTVQNQRIKQFNARPEQTEYRRLTDTTLARLIQQGQANLGSIRRQNPQTMPKRLCWDGLIDQTQQFRIERIKNVGQQMTTRLGKSTGSDHA